jgi:hypothetical protein
MAVLALAVAGAALAPAGYAAVGWTVGQVVGQLLFPGKLPDQQGPRVGDLRAQQSQYGAAIPILYGTTRVAGNVIWSTDLIETATTQRSGGKGGPSQTQTTYSYRVSMAILLGEGPLLGVRRIWADGKLIYNAGDAATPSTVAASYALAQGITFYPGSELQEPDPTMEAYLGVGNVPAYRGRAYLVLQDLQLADYGNRRPNITAEVIAAGSTGDQTRSTTLPAASFIRGFEYGSGVFVAVGFSTSYAFLSGDSVNWRIGFTFPGGFSPLVLGYGNGEFITMGSSTTGYFSSDGVSWTAFTCPGVANKNKLRFNGSQWLLVAQGTDAFISTDGRNWTSVSMPPVGSVNWFDARWNGSAWIAIAQATSIAAISSAGGQSWTATALPASGTWTAVESNGSTAIAVSTNVGSARSTDNGQTWSAVTIPGSNNGVAWTGSEWVVVGDGNVNSHLRSEDDGVTWTPSGLPAVTKNHRFPLYRDGIVYTVGTSATPESHAILFDLISGTAPALSAIVSDISQRAGLTAGDIDVTALTDTVDGYAIGQQMSARSAIEPLQRAFFFDAVESGAKVVFRKRGSASVVTIAADELAAHAAGDTLPDDLSMTRQQEPELPASVSVVYIDRDADYQQNTQQAQRGTTLSTQQTGAELAIVMTADRARAIAETLLYDAWTQRQRFTFQTSRLYAAVEPADVVTVTRNGTTHTLRIQQKTESRSGVIQWGAVSEEAAVYTQTATGGAGPQQSSDVDGTSVTRLFTLDIPLLRDADNGLSFYTAASGVGGAWRGSVLYRSSDSGATYDEAGALVTPATAGYASTALAAAANPHMFDEANTVTVELYGGTLSSAPELTVLNGANFILIGSEILQFKTATLVGTNRYTLSGLLRGRRGTEWAMSTHVAGERVVLLTADSLGIQTGTLNAAVLFKPVSIGRTVQETSAQAFTYTGVNLEAFSPVELGGGRNSGDLTITWRRRSRLGVDLPLFYDPPLGETTQSFEVEIWNSTFTVLRRTITGITTLSTTYTGAQQITDAGSLQDPVYVRVFQMSATVGRGFALQGAI